MRAVAGRRLQVWVLAMVAALAGATAPLFMPAPARADGTCLDGALCLYQDINFGGHMLWLTNWPEANFNDSGFNDVTSSILNNSNNTWCVYEDANYGGNWALMPPHTQLAWVGDYFNDKASSARFC